MRATRPPWEVAGLTRDQYYGRRRRGDSCLDSRRRGARSTSEMLVVVREIAGSSLSEIEQGVLADSLMMYNDGQMSTSEKALMLKLLAKCGSAPAQQDNPFAQLLDSQGG